MTTDNCALCALEAERLRMLDPGNSLLKFSDNLHESKVEQEFLALYVPADFVPSPHPISDKYERMVKAFDGYLVALRQTINCMVQTT